MLETGKELRTDPMRQCLLTLTTCLALGFATTGFAQTTTGDATTAPPAADAIAATPPADATKPTDLSMGTDATAPTLPSQTDAEVGKTYLAATFDTWEQRCLKTADGSDPCQLYKLLKDKDSNPVAEISLFDIPAGGQAVAGATVMVPLETLLTASLQIAVDGNKPKLYPFTYCAVQGCISRVGFTADELLGLQKGVKAVFTIVPAVAPDKTVDLDLSLKGFTAGYTAVKTANARVKP